MRLRYRCFDNCLRILKRARCHCHPAARISVMAMMLAYSGLMALDLSFFTISSVLGAWISAGMLLIAWRYHTRKRSAALGE